MRRIQEKVKDIVDARPYKSLRDFTSDPMQTVSIYRFTDFTSDLMAKWLDRIAAVQAGNGAAYALAGYRGVGKSHFSAALGAIVAHPELRSRVTDAHVAASADRLRRTRYPIAYVRRGTDPTLIGEIKNAIAKTFEIPADNLGDSVSELINFAARKAGELPFLLFVDTDFERASRVARDDGAMLGEIARLAKNLNVFVAVALDDDIAGADGINAAIAGNFTIDYLDQEHLYRIVDSHIFPKHRQMQPVLHDIYSNFKESLPHFRWSEQRFASLYPLHPILLEIAPFVRLYEPEFALLGFAAEAGVKILGRPANSLIALDEVFDTVEKSFRKSPQLKELFEGYDRLSVAINVQIPILQRLQAKLILKALFLLSIEGGGTTAGEISAAMLITDENEPLRAVKSVEEILEKFVSILPAEIQRIAEDGREVRYNFKVSNQDDLKNAVNEAAKKVSPAVAERVLRRTARARFADLTISEIPGAQNAGQVEFETVWRGSVRHNRLIWNWANRISADDLLQVNRRFDWEIIIGQMPEDFHLTAQANASKMIFWESAPLKSEEVEAILRYWVLLTDTNLRQKHGEHLRAFGHAQMLVVEKIWNRIFLEDAKLITGNLDYNFSESAQNSLTVQELFSKTLAPFFEQRFPDHPQFAEVLGKAEVSALVNDFFSGARQNLAETQHLAKIFALPLGLVREGEKDLILESPENLQKLTFVQQILTEVENNAGEMVSLGTIYERLEKSPIGLAREAQQLILTALVANRRIEFVTSNGDRISRRSLDLKVIWDDIAGIAKPSGTVYSSGRLSEWARLLTGAEFQKNFSNLEDQSAARAILEKWLTDWKNAGLLEHFKNLPDEILNTKIWRMATHAKKSFGAVAEAIEISAGNSISLEDTLQIIADSFSDSENEFRARSEELVFLDDFINGCAISEKIWSYLAVCETTEDENLELLREKLFRLIEQNNLNSSAALNREMENLWKTFHERFVEYYLSHHDASMKSEHLQDKIKEILKSEEWREFESLSALPNFEHIYWHKAEKMRGRLARFDCRFDTRAILSEHPFCACAFSLMKIREAEILSAEFIEIVKFGRENYKKDLNDQSRTLISRLENYAADDEEKSHAARRLIKILNADYKLMPPLSSVEMLVLQEIISKSFEAVAVEIITDSETILQGI